MTFSVSIDYKLSALFRRQEPDWLQVELSRWGSAGADNAKFVQLKEAILSRRVLSFTYVGASGQTTRRSVLPARLDSDERKIIHHSAERCGK